YGKTADRLSHKASLAIVDKALGHAVQSKQILHLMSGIEEYRVAYFLLGEEPPQYGGLLVGNGEDDQSLGPEALGQCFQIGDLHAAGWAPGGPEVEKHHLAAQALQVPFLALKVDKSEVGLAAMLVVGFESRNRGRVPRVVERNLHVVVASQFRQHPVFIVILVL